MRRRIAALFVLFWVGEAPAQRPADPEADIRVLQRDLQALADRTDLRFEAVSEAQRLQAAELARRLEILNHEADRLREMQATYVPREVYESQQRVLVGAVITVCVGLLFMFLRYVFRQKE